MCGGWRGPVRSPYHPQTSASASAGTCHTNKRDLEPPREIIYSKSDFVIDSHRQGWEWPWANRSHCFLQERNRERFAPIALDKRAIVSESLSSIFKKERHYWFARDASESLSKTSDLLEKIHFLVVVDSFSQFFPFFMSKSKSVPSLFAPSLFFTSKSFFRSQKTSNSL